MFFFEMAGKFKGRDVISIRDFSKDDLLNILATAKKLEANPMPSLMKSKIMGTLFFEPSTRTRLSFTSAMEKMGGHVLGFETPDVTSVTKGETVWDTIKMVENYVDVIVIRHRLEGAARLAAEASHVPVINAGDGANQHPTQTMLDMYTILKEKGKLDGLNIGFVGDLKYGRTVHSLSIALSHFRIKQHFIAPEALQIPESYLDRLDKRGIPYSVEEDLLKSAKELDVIYMTRIQKERFPDPVEYNKLKGVYQIGKSLLNYTKKDVIVLHPLPRVDEIKKEFDDTPNAAYFRQAANGVPVRQAIIALVTGMI
ncbi:MAG: aspartate carbamoyltransferase [Candidatus Woesearchaeota archaeon]|nr:aspartate carbamoyltransferase [Candidatus Woesearchaeota archaeon]